MNDYRGCKVHKHRDCESYPHITAFSIMDSPSIDYDPEIAMLTQGTESLLFPEEPVKPQSKNVPTSHSTATSQNSFLPGARVVDSANIVYIIDAAGSAVPIRQERMQGMPRPLTKKPKKFYHSKGPRNKHTSHEVLLQSHTALLESIKYDSVMDSSSTGRYGKWDTTSTLYNARRREHMPENESNASKAPKE